MRRTGRLPPHASFNAPRLADYRLRAVAPPPAKVDFYTGVPWGMFCNDAIGDCTIAGIANGIVQRTALANGTPLIMPDAMVRDTYFGLTGGPDSGLVETDVLSWFATRGIDLGRQAPECGVWARVDHTDLDALRRAIAEFGSVYVGWALPQTALSASLWDAVTGPGTEGHCTLIVGYEPGAWYCATWGEIIPATDAFLGAYLEESYVVSAVGEWLSVTGLSPSHYDFEGLRAAMVGLAGEPVWP